MLDTYTRQSITMPAPCIGTLQKTASKSWFERFGVHSQFSDKVLSENSKVVVLQIMTFGDNEMLAELINKADYIELCGEEA